MKLTRLEILNREISERVEERDAILSAQLDAQLDPLLGKHYRYRNNYSCPEKPEDYWYTYARADYHQGRTFYGRAFQTDSNGSFRFDLEYSFYPANEDMGWEEISAAQFAAAFAEQSNRLTVGFVTLAQPEEYPR